ncbi:hypothetical protein [Balneatrix alpica]|uniref:hypothetical protein n=1 Tax=Balneatrix alpica TaxID=75684 RepID=UPI0027381C5C|nr:hypothetical protein [Balneatrix alpica]
MNNAHLSLQWLAVSALCLFFLISPALAVPVSCPPAQSITLAEVAAMDYVAYSGKTSRSYTTLFRPTKIQKTHRSGARELVSYVKWRGYHYSIYVEIGPNCQSVVTKRTHARP